MKLSEALIQRADIQKRIEQLNRRIRTSARVQQGTSSPENPQELLAEVTQQVENLHNLIKRVNRTNNVTRFDDSRTISDALADRDALMTERRILTDAVTAAVGAEQRRYRDLPIIYESTIDVPEIQRRIDNLSRQYRELDSRIQALNWTVELLD